MIDELRRSGILSTAAKVGDRLPEFSLTNAQGRSVSAAALLAAGPLVLTFYRGGWCPYCNLQLKAYQKALPELARRGAALVAVSPETPDESLSTSQKDGLEFEVLSDVGNALAARMGLVFTMPADLKARYLAAGIDLEKTQGNPDWRLPLAATFVIGRDGVIRWRFVDVDYKLRAEVADILAALDAP